MHESRYVGDEDLKKYKKDNLNKRHLSKANVIVMIVLSLFISY